MKASALLIGCVLFALAAHAQTPTLTLVTPAQSSTVPSGPLVVEFAVANWTLGGQGQDHLNIYVDADPTPNQFFNAPTNEVLRSGAHTHFIHWNTSTSAAFNALSAGAHALRFVLADAANVELTSPQATFTLNVTVQAPTGGDFTLTSMVPSLNFPVAMAFAPDMRLFYTEKSGGMRVMDYVSATQSFTLQAAPVFTVAVNTASERGLLGVCLDPNFSSNGYLYCYYTRSSPIVNRVSRFTITTMSGDTVVVPGSELVLIDNIPSPAGNHNGGNLHFGPDGSLYITIGEGGSTPANSQNANNMLGKILRVNPANGAAAAGNPSFGGTEARLFCLGLRNSFDFCFHHDTGDLWASENGPGSDDEINRIVAGANYGWPNVQGIASTPPYIDPIAEYTPTIAPTGIMCISDNSNYPPQYHHNLLMAAFNNGTIRRYVLAGPNLDMLGSDTIAYAGGNGGITDIEEAPNGWIYAFAGAFPGAGGLFRVDLVNAPPMILSAAPTNAYVGVNYSYTILASGTPTITYMASGLPTWLTLTGNVLSGTPAAGDLGTMANVTITATNGQGNDMQMFTITVNAAPPGNGKKDDDGGSCSAGIDAAPWLILAALCGLFAAWRARRAS